MRKNPTKTIFLAFTLNTAAIADYFRALADELVRRGYLVVIISDGKRTHKVSENTNPAIYTWPSKRPTRVADARFLYKLIKRYRPMMSFSNFGADNINLIVSWLLRVPLRFVTYHTMLNPELTRKPISPAICLQIFRKRLIYRLASAVLPVAGAMKNELMEFYRVPADRIEVFHNAIASRPELIRKEVKTQPDLISAGGLTRGKGHDVLIRALKIVKIDFPEVNLTIYGEGPERGNLERLIMELGLEDNVELEGNVPHDAVIQAMSDAYALIHPTRVDALPYSVIEAISVGTPVIASAIGGIPEIIRDGLDGFLVPPDEPAVLAERVSRLCSDPKLRNEMSQNCQYHFLDDFEINNAVHKQAEWFEMLIREVYENTPPQFETCK